MIRSDYYRVELLKTHSYGSGKPICVKWGNLETCLAWMKNPDERWMSYNRFVTNPKFQLIHVVEEIVNLG